mmetsp:Transcript_33826/g.74013  ORF Transcript_33826/g.74013 Transcript_33826/m.74013 type:complete len:330 (+) Transcript_33826:56-1045(+)
MRTSFGSARSGRASAGGILPGSCSNSEVFFSRISSCLEADPPKSTVGLLDAYATYPSTGPGAQVATFGLAPQPLLSGGFYSSVQQPEGSFVYSSGAPRPTSTVVSGGSISQAPRSGFALGAEGQTPSGTFLSTGRWSPSGSFIGGMPSQAASPPCSVSMTQQDSPLSPQSMSYTTAEAATPRQSVSCTCVYSQVPATSFSGQAAYGPGGARTPQLGDWKGLTEAQLVPVVEIKQAQIELAQAQLLDDEFDVRLAALENLVPYIAQQEAISRQKGRNYCDQYIRCPVNGFYIDRSKVALREAQLAGFSAAELPVSQWLAGSPRGQTRGCS